MVFGKGVMRHRFGRLAAAVILLVCGPFTGNAGEALGVELEPATIAAYARYVQATESRIQAEMERPGAFLYVEGLPERRRGEAFENLRDGEVYMERLYTLDASGREMTAPDTLDLPKQKGGGKIPRLSLLCPMECCWPG